MRAIVQENLIKDFIREESLKFKQFAHGMTSDDLLTIIKFLKSNRDIALIGKLVDDDKFLEILKSADQSKITILVKKLDFEQMVYYFGMLSTEEREEVCKYIPLKLSSELMEVINYPHNTAGSLMVRRIPKFDASAVIRDAVKVLKSKDFIHTQHVFVVDEGGHYLGVIPASLLLTNPQNTQLTDIMLTDVPSISSMSNKEDLEQVINDYYLPVLPVVDSNNLLIGMIRTENILKTLQEESISAIQTMVGVSKDEKVLSSPWLAIKKRLPWLNINLVTAFLAAAVVGFFESTIAKYTALAVLLPVIAGQAGNTGAQAQAVMMRGLALREIHIKQSYKAIFKELIAGLVNGIVIGFVTALGVYIWSQSAGLALLIGGSMILALVIAGVSGILVPVILTIFRQDPAQSSSIILTTITDCSSFGIFLILASMFLEYL